jgi:hypothetical protein
MKTTRPLSKRSLGLTVARSSRDPQPVKSLKLRTQAVAAELTGCLVGARDLGLSPSESMTRGLRSPSLQATLAHQISLSPQEGARAREDLEGEESVGQIYVVERSAARLDGAVVSQAKQQQRRTHTWV